MPCGPLIVRKVIPDSIADEISSCVPTCADSSHTTACPDRVNACIAIWLQSVPVGRYSAACLPVSAATRSCNRMTVGSSPNRSSPTSASAMARRIAAVGLVTVSERRSTYPLSAMPPLPRQASRSRALPAEDRGVDGARLGGQARNLHHGNACLTEQGGPSPGREDRRLQPGDHHAAQARG